MMMDTTVGADCPLIEERMIPTPIATVAAPTSPSRKSLSIVSSLGFACRTSVNFGRKIEKLDTDCPTARLAGPSASGFGTLTHHLCSFRA